MFLASDKDTLEAQRESVENQTIGRRLSAGREGRPCVCDSNDDANERAIKSSIQNRHARFQRNRSSSSLVGFVLQPAM